MGRKMQPRLRKLACSTAVAVAFVCGAGVAQAQSTAPQTPPPPVEVRTGQDLDKIFKEAEEINLFAQASQERIDSTASETQRLLIMPSNAGLSGIRKARFPNCSSPLMKWSRFVGKSPL
jgi:hypothetical protein